MNYPSGVKKNANSKRKSKQINYTNRGMTLEDDINITNEYYLNNNLAIIHKKPTPVQIVNVHYPKRSAAVITEAYLSRLLLLIIMEFIDKNTLISKLKKQLIPLHFPLAIFMSIK